MEKEAGHRIARWKALVLTAVVLVSVATPRPAEAFIKDWSSVVWLVAVLETTLVIGGMTTMIACGVYGGRGERAPVGWIATGYTFGILNIGWGGLMIGFGRSSGPAVMGGLHIALGGLGVGMAAWTQTRKRKEGSATTGLSIGPIRLSDRSGRPVLGLGLRYVH